MTTRVVVSGTIEGYEKLKGMSLEELSEKLGIAVTGVELVVNSVSIKEVPNER